MKFQAPLLVVTDLAVSRKFYEDLLGQKVVLDFGANITFDGGFSLQTKDSWAEFIDKPASEITMGGNGFELYFETDDFDGFLVRYKAYPSVQAVHEVKEYPWGQSVLRFYDPDRHMIEVGQSMVSVAKRFLAQGMSPEAVAERTQHPIEFVKFCMEN